MGVLVDSGPIDVPSVQHSLLAGMMLPRIATQDSFETSSHCLNLCATLCGRDACRDICELRLLFTEGEPLKAESKPKESLTGSPAPSASDDITGVARFIDACLKRVYTSDQPWVGWTKM